MPVAVPMTLEDRLHHIQVRINRLSEKEETPRVLSKVKRLKEIEEKLLTAVLERRIEQFEAAMDSLERSLEKTQKRIGQLKFEAAMDSLERSLEKTQKRIEQLINLSSTQMRRRLREVEVRLQAHLAEKAKISNMVNNHTIGETSEE